MPLEDDRGSIALLLLVVLVGLALGGLLVPMIITQDRTTRFDTTRVQALDAAQAGLDVMLGNIRRATNGEMDVTGGTVSRGDASKLPCPTSPIIGTVAGGPAAYSVGVTYYSADPIQNPTATIPCSVGGTLTGTATPAYARLTSTGTVPPAVNGSTNGRTLMSTYQFRTNNTVGGVIATSTTSASGSRLCMDAGAGTPVSGTLVSMLTCSTSSPPLAKQVFAYRNDLTIQLVSSTVSSPPGLCLTPASAGMVSFSTCLTSGAPLFYTQQWSLNQFGAYQTTLATSKIYGVLGTQCLQVSGQQLTVATCSNNAADPVQAWSPSPGVGVGAATLPQWTNYSEFGRCIYIPPSVSNRLWSYPCTENPWAGLVPAGQSFTGPTPATGATSAVGPITSASGTNCLGLTSPASGGWVTTTSKASCSDATLQQWTVYGAGTQSYASRYTIKNQASGMCLGLGTPAYTDTWSVIQTEPCTGAADQKWNVPANGLSLTLQNIEK